MDYNLSNFLSDPFYGYRDIKSEPLDINGRSKDFEKLCIIANTIEGISDPYEASLASVRLAKRVKVDNLMATLEADSLDEDSFAKTAVKAIENKIAINVEKPSALPVSCCTPECTRTAINRSHVIQRNKILSTIIDASNTVLQTKNMPFEGKNFLKSVGWKNASAFPGFCEVCEFEMFSVSESDDAPLTRDVLGKLIWRAACFIRYRRAIELKERALVVSQPKAYEIGTKFDNMIVPLSSMMILKTRMATFRNVDKWIKDFERAGYGMSNRYGFVLMELDFSPFVGAGVLPVHYDFNGKKLQSARSYYKPIQHLAFTSFVSGGKSYFVMCYDKSERHCVKFVKQLLALDLYLLSSFLPQIIVGNSDTVYISPDWWNERADEVDQHIMFHSFMMSFAFMVFPWWGSIKGVNIKSVHEI